MSVYLGLFLVSKYINIVLEGLTRKELYKFVFEFTILNIIQGFLFHGNWWRSGFSIIHALNIYYLGYWLRYNRKVECIKSSLYIIIFTFLTALFSLMKYLTEYVFYSLLSIINVYRMPTIWIIVNAIVTIFFVVIIEHCNWYVFTKFNSENFMKLLQK